MGMNATVNLKQMENKANSLVQRGGNLAARFDYICDDVKEMQKYWQGESYVNFVNVVNKLIPELNKMQKYFSETLPQAIIKKRNQYAKADQKKQVQLKDVTKWTAIELIKVKDQGDEMIFNSAGMNKMTSQLDTRFNAILMTNLPNIKNDFNAITWKGSTGDELKKKFKAQMERTENDIKKIRAAYRNCLAQQAKSMDSAEEVNRTMSGLDTSGMSSASAAADAISEILKNNPME